MFLMCPPQARIQLKFNSKEVVTGFVQSGKIWEKGDFGESQVKLGKVREIFHGLEKYMFSRLNQEIFNPPDILWILSLCLPPTIVSL